MSDTPQNNDYTKLLGAVRSDLQYRASWEDRQSLWYRMRNRGVGRTSLPYKGASDFHWRLIDGIIDELKPLYYQQAIGPDPICQFVPKKPNAPGSAALAGQWFDYQIRTRSNFRKAILQVVDLVLERGKGILKPLWDFEAKALRFECIDPVDVVVPPHTEGLQDATRITNVIRLSRQQYLEAAKAGRWDTSDDWLQSLTGGERGTMREDVDEQEGTNNPMESDVVTLWEVYCRYLADDGKVHWRVHLLSPNRNDKAVRPTLSKVPYLHGRPPFIEFNYEVKARSYYSSRGLCELIGQDEMTLNKLQNSKHDFMDFANRPIFTHDGATLNAQNHRVSPGQIIGNNLKPLAFPQPPVSFDSEAQNIRTKAEKRIGVPDYGITQGQDKKKSTRTATEINAVQGLSGQSTDLRSNVFRDALSQTFDQSWQLLLQYAKDCLEFYYRDNYGAISNTVLNDVYVLEPNGQADGFNKDTEAKRITELLQIPVVQQFMDPEKTTRALLELVNPRYLSTIFKAGNLQQNDQMEEQADEIGNMLLGFQVSISPEDDDAIHLQSMMQFFDFRTKTQTPVPPIPSLIIYQHFQAHAQALPKKNPNGYKQMEQQLRNALRMIESSTAQIQQYLQHAPMPHGMQAPPGGPVAPDAPTAAAPPPGPPPGPPAPAPTNAPQV